MPSVSRYRLLIFDFDGTLADSFPVFSEALAEAIEHFGLRRVEQEDVTVLRGLSAGEIISYLQIPFWKVPSVGRFVHERMCAARSTVALFAGVEALLAELSAAGGVVSIVSSNTEDSVRATLGEQNSRHIQFFECGASLFGKAARFRKVLKRAGIGKDAALCVGDEIRDLDAARSAGISFGAVAWGYTHVAALERLNPAHVFQTVDEIQALALSMIP